MLEESSILISKSAKFDQKNQENQALFARMEDVTEQCAALESKLASKTSLFCVVRFF